MGFEGKSDLGKEEQRGAALVKARAACSWGVPELGGHPGGLNVKGQGLRRSGGGLGSSRTGVKTEAGLGVPESVTSFSWERDMRESLDDMRTDTQ